MLLGSNDHIKVARRAAVSPGIPFARNANALSVARACLGAHFERLGFRVGAFAMAGRTGRQIFARTVASRALHVELHPSTGLRDLPRPVALRTFPRSFQEALPVTIRANIVARDIQAHHPAADRGPERHVDLVFQIGPGFGTFLRRRCSAPSAEDSSEDVAEATLPGAPPESSLQKCRGSYSPPPPPPPVPSSAPALRCRPGQKNRTRQNRRERPGPRPAPRRGSRPEIRRLLPHRRPSAHRPPPSPDQYCRSRTRPGRRFCVSWDR